eukprot:TRINITY_DN11551_c0_g1_i1.p1 TRINITY_DN11551_c0_g1~~TRINITY_DN11551_c0_g1_i1.p1  ORF type:complete len:978 (+),score=242.72 TRINITY_DN11551_c0_g1_i1:145-3078(+)
MAGCCGRSGGRPFTASQFRAMFLQRCELLQTVPPTVFVERLNALGSSKLTKINASSCQFDDRQTAALVAALQEDRAITDLDLSKNYIGDMGAAALASVISSHPTLNVVDLRENHYSERSSVVLLRAAVGRANVRTLLTDTFESVPLIQGLHTPMQTPIPTPLQRPPSTTEQPLLVRRQSQSSTRSRSSSPRTPRTPRTPRQQSPSPVPYSDQTAVTATSAAAPVVAGVPTVSVALNLTDSDPPVNTAAPTAAPTTTAATSAAATAVSASVTNTVAATSTSSMEVSASPPSRARPSPPRRAPSADLSLRRRSTSTGQSPLVQAVLKQQLIDKQQQQLDQQQQPSALPRHTSIEMSGTGRYQALSSPFEAERARTPSSGGSLDDSDIRLNMSAITAQDVPLLDLSDSSLQNMLGLDTLTAVQELNLSHNQIARIDFVPPNLRSLDLSFNNVSEMDGLTPLTQLRILDLSHNAIKRMDGMKTTTKLHTLNLSFNRIKTVRGVDTLPHLKSVNLANNGIVATEALQALSALRKLVTLDLRNNPVTTVSNYRQVVFRIVPSIRELDGTIFNDIPALVAATGAVSADNVTRQSAPAHLKRVNSIVARYIRAPSQSPVQQPRYEEAAAQPQQPEPVTRSKSIGKRRESSPVVARVRSPPRRAGAVEPHRTTSTTAAKPTPTSAPTTSQPQSPQQSRKSSLSSADAQARWNASATGWKVTELSSAQPATTTVPTAVGAAPVADATIRASDLASAVPSSPSPQVTFAPEQAAPTVSAFTRRTSIPQEVFGGTERFVSEAESIKQEILESPPPEEPVSVLYVTDQLRDQLITARLALNNLVIMSEKGYAPLKVVEFRKQLSDAGLLRQYQIPEPIKEMRSRPDNTQVQQLFALAEQLELTKVTLARMMELMLSLTPNNPRVTQYREMVKASGLLTASDQSTRSIVQHSTEALDPLAHTQPSSALRLAVEASRSQGIVDDESNVRVYQ